VRHRYILAQKTLIIVDILIPTNTNTNTNTNITIITNSNNTEQTIVAVIL
jgi:hypothetical protein